MLISSTNNTLNSARQADPQAGAQLTAPPFHTYTQPPVDALCSSDTIVRGSDNVLEITSCVRDALHAFSCSLSSHSHSNVSDGAWDTLYLAEYSTIVNGSFDSIAGLGYDLA